MKSVSEKIYKASVYINLAAFSWNWFAGFYALDLSGRRWFCLFNLFCAGLSFLMMVLLVRWEEGRKNSMKAIEAADYWRQQRRIYDLEQLAAGKSITLEYVIHTRH